MISLETFGRTIAPPVNPYSHAARRGRILAVAGQVGIDPRTEEMVPGGADAQAERALLNMQAVLMEADASFEDVIMIRIYLADLADFAAVNKVYTQFFREPFPARTTVGVQLPGDLLVELDALAVLGV